MIRADSLRAGIKYSPAITSMDRPQSPRRMTTAGRVHRHSDGPSLLLLALQPSHSRLDRGLSRRTPARISPKHTPCPSDHPSCDFNQDFGAVITFPASPTFTTPPPPPPPSTPPPPNLRSTSSNSVVALGGMSTPATPITSSTSSAPSSTDSSSFSVSGQNGGV